MNLRPFLRWAFLLLILQISGWSQTWTSLGNGLEMPFINAVAASPSAVVAVGSGRRIATLNKQTGVWTVRRLHTTDEFVEYRDIVYANGQFVAVGDASTIVRSVDGHSWSLVSQYPNQYYFSILWDGNQYILTGSGSSILTSPNGITWTSRLVSPDLFLRSAAFSGTRYVAVGTYGIRISTDSQIWTTPAGAPASVRFTACTWTGTRFVAAGWDNVQRIAVIYNGADGESWSFASTLSELFIGSVMTLNGAVFVTGHKGPGYGSIRKSTDDGVTWKDIYTGANGAECFTDLALDGEKLVVVGHKSNVWSTSLLSVSRNEQPDLGIRHLPGRLVELDVKTRWGKLHQTQVSTDLVSWADFGDPMSGDGRIRQVADNLGTDSQRYYRVLITPEALGDGGLRIMEARFGANGVSADVRTHVESRIIGDSVTMMANNGSLGGDPNVGVYKSLFVRYRISSGVFEATFLEGTTFTIPHSSHMRID